MKYFELLVQTINETAPAAMKMSEEEYQAMKSSVLKDAANTGRLSIYQFMVEVFESLDHKRAQLSKN